MRTIKSLGALLLCALSAVPVMAQQTYEEMEQLTVNEQVTTVITASEPVRFVDISTDKVVGDQPINNTIRLKPKEGADVHADGDVLAIVTIVTERYRQVNQEELCQAEIRHLRISDQWQRDKEQIT